MTKAALKRTSPLLDGHRAVIERFARDANRPFLDPAELPWVAELEASWQTFRRDLDDALAAREEIPGFGALSTRQARLAPKRWSSLLFRIYGRRVEENCARYPATAALLDRIPDMTTAMFSILGEGAHIPAHFGPFKGVLRYHLGLLVPPSARLRVDTETRAWAEGKSLLFDDTFEHEAWNPGPGNRVVLFVDVIRPLRGALGMFNRACVRLAGLTGEVREMQRRAGMFARNATAPNT